VKRGFEERYSEQEPALRERAAGSEDAFDAAVSAPEMARYVEQFQSLPALAGDAPQRIEGEIWIPETSPGRT
jgi:hypothetical protein